MTLQAHQKIVGWLTAGINALTLAGLIVAIGGPSALFAEQQGALGEVDFRWIAIPLLAFTALVIVAGVAFALGRRWPRYVLWPAAILGLFAIPIGTVLGAYTIWVLAMKEQEVFNGDT
jgi:hypothetical protein